MSDFTHPPSRNVRHTFLLFVSYQVCSTLLQQFKLTVAAILSLHSIFALGCCLFLPFILSSGPGELFCFITQSLHGYLQVVQTHCRLFPMLPQSHLYVQMSPVPFWSCRFSQLKLPLIQWLMEVQIPLLNIYKTVGTEILMALYDSVSGYTVCIYPVSSLNSMAQSQPPQSIFCNRIPESW